MRIHIQRKGALDLLHITQKVGRNMHYVPEDLVLLATRYGDYISTGDYEKAARMCTLLHRITGYDHDLPHHNTTPTN